MANEEEDKESWDLRDWLTIEPEDAIAGMYEKTLEFSENKVSWYLEKIRGKRFVSQTSRLVSFIFLASGTILPLLAGLSNDQGQRFIMTQLGVVSLAVAGLAQVADKAFGWSSGWMRFIKTVTEMEMRTSSFESEWFEYELNKPSLDKSDIGPLFDITKDLRQDLEQMQLVETNGWITEFNAGIALLETAINSQREKAKKDLKLLRDDYNKKLRENEDALRKGAINLSLTYPQPIKSVDIVVDDKVIQTNTSAQRINVSGLQPGIRSVRLFAPDSENELASIGVSVSPGEVTEAKIDLS